MGYDTYYLSIYVFIQLTTETEAPRSQGEWMVARISQQMAAIQR